MTGQVKYCENPTLFLVLAVDCAVYQNAISPVVHPYFLMWKKLAFVQEAVSHIVFSGTQKSFVE